MEGTSQCFLSEFMKLQIIRTVGTSILQDRKLSLKKMLKPLRLAAETEQAPAIYNLGAQAGLSC